MALLVLILALFMRRFDTLFWKHRNVLAGLPFTFALLSTASEFESEVVIWPLAIALCSLGIALRSWGNCHCWYAQRRPMVLTTSGPYAYVRNPLYIGNLLIITGAIVASELIWFIPVGFLWAFLVYSRVVKYEEDRLLARFGDAFLRYRDQVPKWVPVLRGERHGLWIGKGDDHFFAVAMRQALNLLILLPFFAKELNLQGLWLHP